MNVPNETSTSPTPETSQSTATAPETTTTPITTTPETDNKSLLGTPKEEGQAPEGKVEGQKTEGEKPAEVAEPLTMEAVTVPEGFVVDEPVMNSFLEIMNEEMSPQERAQKLVDLQASVQKQASEASSKLWTDMQEAWRDETMKDPVHGGANWVKTESSISRLIESFGGPAEEQKALRQVMDFTGAGNNPHVIKFLARVADKLVVEGAPVVGAPTGKSSAATLAQRMFPDLP